MIELTKLNGKMIALNPDQMESIEMIPETKVMMMNGRYYIVKETMDKIIEKIIAYNLQAGRTRLHTVVEREKHSEEE